jgi:hypothetical protein
VPAWKPQATIHQPMANNNHPARAHRVCGHAAGNTPHRRCPAGGAVLGAGQPKARARWWSGMERVLTTAGLVASGSGMLSLLAYGLGWASASVLPWLWLGLTLGAVPLCPWLHRKIQPLFWF